MAHGRMGRGLREQGLVPENCVKEGKRVRKEAGGFRLVRTRIKRILKTWNFVIGSNKDLRAISSEKRDRCTRSASEKKHKF
jgi:hypothetical protein